MDDMIEHQIQFEESTETQIDTLKTLLASFSRAMWLEKEGKLRTKSKSPEVVQKKFKLKKPPNVIIPDKSGKIAVARLSKGETKIEEVDSASGDSETPSPHKGDKD